MTETRVATRPWSSPPPEPVPTPQTVPYWEFTARGILALRRCRSCAAVFHRPVGGCPECGAEEAAWFPASGRATLFSYVIVHRGEGAFADRVPYAVALVRLAEGPVMVTGVVDVAQTPEALRLDMPLRVRFEPRGGYALPVFAPEPEAGP
ncbi:OB-fold domain-containing protein [Actinomadura sp. DC4]|uniref:Zn-ribbon domain-containing OB-fold protein n=1 Tax=Actinomadura sp. DC4 TaxID=3055069 RepID=UPI0025B1BF30|nr:OB-fold domain-containing protein [Actinomadura sp. DC4]MDN3356351.1 OB-fold domain-containing protein [Actinomadura sp. DC4]